MNRLTETKLEREVRISFAYIDHITDEACKKLDLLKKEYEPKKAKCEQLEHYQVEVALRGGLMSAAHCYAMNVAQQQSLGARNRSYGGLQNSQAPYGNYGLNSLLPIGL